MTEDEVVERAAEAAKSRAGKVIGGLVLLVLLAVVLGLGYRVMFLTWTENYQLVYTFHGRTGDIARVSHNGYVYAPPIMVKVHTIDLRPMQVCISSNQRVLNCKLVQFDPAGLELFLSWHGRSDYSATSLSEILKAYAYEDSGKSYSFLKVIRELKNAELDAPVAAADTPVSTP